MIDIHTGVFASGLGWKVKYTKHKNMPVQQPKATNLGPGLAELHNTQNEHPWRQHQSLAYGKKRKVFVGGMPKFDFEYRKTQAQVQRVYALRGVQYNGGK